MSSSGDPAQGGSAVRGGRAARRGQPDRLAAAAGSFWGGYDLLWADREAPPARRSLLDRARIVRAAVLIADAEGLAAVTMRRIASELRTGAMSLYRHVPDKDALVSLMIDHVLGEQELPDAPSGSWREDLRTLASSMWDFIQQHPWYPEAVMERPPITPHGVAAFEFALSILDDTELPVVDRAPIVITLTSTVMAAAQNAAAEARTRSRLHVTDEEITSSVGAFLGRILADGHYPRFQQAVTNSGRLDPKGEMQMQVELILDGAAARIEAARKPGGAPA